MSLLLAIFRRDVIFVLPYISVYIVERMESQIATQPGTRTGN